MTHLLPPISVTAVMVTYNRSKIVSEAIDCLQKQKFPVSNIVIVDNASTDNTRELLQKRQAEDKRLHLIFEEENGGYASGLASGIKWALQHLTSQFFWLMDDDSYPVADALELLVSRMEGSDYDMLGLTGFRLTWTNKYTVVPGQTTQLCDYILIDNALIRSQVVEEVGTPDKDYFMMCEDYDYCIRIKRAGFKIGIINNDHVSRLHLGSGKYSQNTLWRGYYHARNHMLILRKYFTFKTFVHYVVIQLKYLIGSIPAPDRWLRIKLRLIGIADGLRSVKGKTLQPDTLRFIR